MQVLQRGWAEPVRPAWWPREQVPRIARMVGQRGQRVRPTTPKPHVDPTPMRSDDRTPSHPKRISPNNPKQTRGVFCRAENAMRGREGQMALIPAR